MDTVSAIIPTYNRFNYLLNAIDSIANQTYTILEIIIVNDASTQPEYYDELQTVMDDKGHHNVQILHLADRSSKQVGHPCVGHVRNQGILKATGKYIAFCDDDDVWFPNKIQEQITAIRSSGCKMSCTDGLVGHGMCSAPPPPTTPYKRYNAQHNFLHVRKLYQKVADQKGTESLMKHGYPNIWTLEFLSVCNCVINSSVVVDKNILVASGMVPHHRRAQDYACWLAVLKNTNCVYINQALMYYDTKHGDGPNH